MSKILIDLVAKQKSGELPCPVTALIAKQQLSPKCVFEQQMSHLVGKPTMWFSNSSDTNQAAQSQKQARSLKFRI